MRITKSEQWICEETVRGMFANYDLCWKRMENDQVMALLPLDSIAMAWDRKLNRMVYFTTNERGTLV